MCTQLDYEQNSTERGKKFAVEVTRQLRLFEVLLLVSLALGMLYPTIVCFLDASERDIVFQLVHMIGISK